MERVVPGAAVVGAGRRPRRDADVLGDHRDDALRQVPFALVPAHAAVAWLRSLADVDCFFTANALRSRRTHSVISAPVYLFAAALLGGSAVGLFEVRNLDGVAARRRHHRR